VRISLASQAVTTFPADHSGRLPQFGFRGLLSVHSRYGLHDRQVPLQNLLHQRLQPFCYLHDCSDCFRLERKLPDGIRTRWKTAPWHGALVFPPFSNADAFGVVTKDLEME
jgi:hypothetical protein